jgi:CDP-6-deoxy-D-xylo-4-hexulose-3-dehydrase
MENLRERLKEISLSILPKYVKNFSNFREGQLVQYSGQIWDDEEIFAAMNCFLNGSWITAGENVEEFQNMFSCKYNVKYSHMLNSGSSANLVMVASLKKLFSWEDGDEVIVSPVGFPTTISPLVQNNLKPVFIDIEFESLNFDVDLIEEKITDKTKAIFVSPVLGNPPDMDRIKDICKKHELLLIGDNCDSLGTLWKGENISNLYYCWSTSFYPAHHISTGEGGMVSSNDENLIRFVASFSTWGRDCHCVGTRNLSTGGSCGKRFSKWLKNYDGDIDHKYIYTNMGYNLKPLDLQGAIGIAQLSKVDSFCEKRREYKKTIQRFIEENIPEVRIINATENSDPSWFGVPIVCDNQETKEQLVSYFERKRIQTRNYFAGNILLHPAYEHLDDYKKYVNANCVLSKVFFIGCSPLYNDLVLKYIEKVCRKWTK